ncbi:unnamed protein product [Arctia plantaginis]|uniref:Uncharacterized protein n=1 Tax=Arctia plantaginis TaxID=874455 RepID=A0A8S0ZBH3_ARCPL|nr:unnamed protein product [Arctia plantaginis]
MECKTAQSPVAPTNLQLLKQLSELRSTLDTIMKQLSPLATLVEDVKLIKQDVSDLKDSVNFAQKTADDSISKIGSLVTRVSHIEAQTNSLDNLKMDMAKLKEDLQDKEQWARANNVEIKGVPLSKSENLYDIVAKITKNIKCTIRKEDINYIARVPSLKSDSSKSIIMALNNRYTKEEFVAAARQHKGLSILDLGYNGEGKVFINDHLTLHNKALLKKVKKKKSSLSTYG